MSNKVNEATLGKQILRYFFLAVAAMPWVISSVLAFILMDNYFWVANVLVVLAISTCAAWIFVVCSWDPFADMDK